MQLSHVGYKSVARRQTALLHVVQHTSKSCMKGLGPKPVDSLPALLKGYRALDRNDTGSASWLRSLTATQAMQDQPSARRVAGGRTLGYGGSAPHRRVQAHAVLSSLLLHGVGAERGRKRGLHKHVALGHGHMVQQWLQVAQSVLERNRCRRHPMAARRISCDLRLLHTQGGVILYRARLSA